MSLIDSINETNSKASRVGEKYLKSSYEYYKLKIFEQLTISVSMVLKIFAIGGLAFVGLTFFATALALSIGKALGSITLGFISVGIICFVVSFILYLFRKHINNFIIKKFSKKFFN